MYAGAAASLGSLLTGIPSAGSIRERASASGGENANVAGTMAVAAFWVTVVLLGLGGTALWLWMAWKNGLGRRWARVTATVFFGVYTVFLVVAVAGGGSVRGGGAVVWRFAVWAIGGSAIVCLYTREARAFYRA